MNVISIGEVLWDVVGDIEHLGGAPLNFAASVARLGHTSHMVSAVADDDRGHRALNLIAQLQVSAEYVSRSASYPTGYVTVALDSGGQPRFTIHRPAAYDDLQLSAKQLQTLRSLQPDWIYFGTLAQTSAAVRDATRAIHAAAPNAKRFYDVNLRPKCFDSQTVVELLQAADVVKLNDAEVETIEQLAGLPRHKTVIEFCRDLADRFNLLAVCVTRGSDGCALLLNGKYIESPAYPITVVDAIGAGDAFAAGLLHGISEGWDARRTADFANGLGALVASRAGAIPAWTLEELDRFSR